MCLLYSDGIRYEIEINPYSYTQLLSDFSIWVEKPVILKGHSNEQITNSQFDKFPYNLLAFSD